MKDSRTSLVSVHVPKTAGTTLLAGLRTTLGRRLLEDYNDRPLAHKRWPRRLIALSHAARKAGQTLPYDCVYGHFLPVKYATCIHTRFATWLREPVQRVVSRYHHYCRHIENEPQHLRHGLVAGLTLEQFVRLPQYQNTYAEYFWGFSLRRFDFIGIVEDFPEELDRFARITGISIPESMPSLNQNPDASDRAYEVPKKLDELIRSLNARDVKIYERALRARDRSGR